MPSQSPIKIAPAEGKLGVLIPGIGAVSTTFIAGVEAYGGLGDAFALTMRDTSHYIAPLIGWQLPKGLRFSFSPGFGLTSTSLNNVYRVGLAFEFEQIGKWLHSSNGGNL